MKFSYSHDEEMFHGLCDSLEEAISEALDADPEAETIYVGEADKRTIGGWFYECDLERLFEQLQSNAAYECGECAEDWLEGPRFDYQSLRECKAAGERAEIRKLHRAKRDEWLKPLYDDVKAALEKWATENGEQPDFWHVSNFKSYSREEAERIAGGAK